MDPKRVLILTLVSRFGGLKMLVVYWSVGPLLVHNLSSSTKEISVQKEISDLRGKRPSGVTEPGDSIPSTGR